MPDPRDYVDYASYLLDWCAAQPDRSTTEMVVELATFAGCSPTQMHYALRRERQLTLAQGRGLVPHLRLPGPQAAHLLNLFELPELPTALARSRREKLLHEMAESQGLSWGTPTALVEDHPGDGALTAALAAGLAAFELDRPTLPQLLEAVVPPASMAILAAAATSPAPTSRVAPRLLRLGDPDQAAAAHQGLLGCAGDALLRLGSQDRDVRAFTTSLDEHGFTACEANDRRLEADLAELARDSELRVPTELSAVLTQRLIVAGPFAPRGPEADPGWRADTVPLPRLEAPAPTAPQEGRPLGLPYPVGATSFPAFMASWCASARALGLPYSERWLATSTRLPPGTVHDLVVGTVRFTADHAPFFYKALGLERDPVGQLALAGMALAAAPDDLRQQAKIIHHLRSMGAQRGVVHAASDAHYVQSQWYAWAIAALASLGGLRAHPGRISRALGGRIDWKTAETTLTILGRLSLVGLDADECVVALTPSQRVESPHSAVALFEQHLGLLNLIRSELGQGCRDLRQSAWVLAQPKAADTRVRRALAQWDADTRETLDAAEQRRKAGARMDRVVLITRQWFPLFRRLDPHRRVDRKIRKSRKKS